jgi:hypothetical protein
MALRKPAETSLRLPRTRTVPATVHLTPEEYFAAAAALVVLSGSDKAPTRGWVQDRALDFVDEMTTRARARRGR